MQTQQTRRTRIGKHLRRNVVAYIALMLAVTMSPLPSWAAGKIGTSDIKNGAVTTKKLAGSAVKGSKIKDGSVGTADLANGAVTSGKLADGAVVAGKLGTIVEVVAASGTVADGATAGVTATCPDGSVLIGGGFDVGGNALPWRVQRNHKDGNGWRAFGTNQSGGSTFLEAKAYCLQP